MNFDVNRCMVFVLCLGVLKGCVCKYATLLYISADFRIFIHDCQDICKLLWFFVNTKGDKADNAVEAGA